MGFQSHRYPQKVCLEGETNKNPGDIVRFTLAMDGPALCAMSGCEVALIVMDDEFYQHKDCPIGIALEETLQQ